jgi:hypothetical protein
MRLIERKAMDVIVFESGANNKQYDLPSNGWHTLTLETFEGPKRDRFKPEKQCVEFTFTLIENGKQLKQKQWCTWTGSDLGRLRKVVWALTGSAPTGPVSLRALIGKKEQAQIERRMVGDKQRSKIISERPLPNVRGVEVTDADLPGRL